MENILLKKAGNLIKDSVLLLRPLKKSEKWNINLLKHFIGTEKEQGI